MTPIEEEKLTSGSRNHLVGRLSRKTGSKRFGTVCVTVCLTIIVGLCTIMRNYFWYLLISFGLGADADLLTTTFKGYT